VCVGLLAAIGQGELLEHIIEIGGRKFRISAQTSPIKIEIVPMDN
jgi:hypothetical protein